MASLEISGRQHRKRPFNRLNNAFVRRSPLALHSALSVDTPVRPMVPMVSIVAIVGHYATGNWIYRPFASMQQTISDNGLTELTVRTLWTHCGLRAARELNISHTDLNGH